MGLNKILGPLRFWALGGRLGPRSGPECWVSVARYWRVLRMLQYTNESVGGAPLDADKLEQCTRFNTYIHS